MQKERGKSEVSVMYYCYMFVVLHSTYECLCRIHTTVPILSYDCPHLVL